MEIRSAFSVGLVALVGLAIFAAAYAFFSRLEVNRYSLTATFADTKGLVKQTPIRMNGVTIGEVKSIDLDPTTLKPKVRLSVEDKVRIPSAARIRITSGLLITTPQVEIDPGKPTGSFLPPNSEWPTAQVEQIPASGLASLAPEANVAVKSLNETLATLKPRMEQTFARLDRILAYTEGTMANIQDASATGRKLLANPNITPTMNSMLRDLKDLSAQARSTTSTLTTELKAMVSRNSPKLDQLADGLVELLTTFRDTVDAARSAATRLSEQVSDPRLQQSLLETLDLTKATIARFNQIASDIHSLTGDAAVQNDLKSTLANVKETTQQGQKLVAKLTDLASKLDLGKGGPRLGIGNPEVMVDFLGRTRSRNFRSDVTMRLPIGENNAARIGLYDFAESNRLTAQWENKIGNGWMRYGLFGGKLGVGLEWLLNPTSKFVLDAWDPNRGRIDARALFKINDNASLWLGADSINKGATPLLGIRLSR